ncbi:hypothetical protein GCM10010353_68700 [Streptomyces chryseus]|nr:hypothetical protein GCM10010353_68700 [Streptomyces chryseus]
MVTHGPMPVASVLLLVAGIAEALQVIHHAGIVHRDLKPSNVLLAVDGPRVIDFGIARAADTTALTGTGVSVGTPSFMSPEQAAGTSCTEATDVFALGQIAVFAATGAAAFGDGASHAVLYRIVHEQPDLSRLPEEPREVVTGCLNKDAALRPSTAQIIEMCGRASQDPALRRPGSWLPSSYAADLTQAAVPAPPPSPAHPATQAAPGSSSAYQATQAAPHTPPIHPPTQPVHPHPAPSQPLRPSVAGPHAYAPAAGHPTQPDAGAPDSYPNHPFPGAAGGHSSGPLPPQQPRKQNRAGLVAAGVAVAALIGGGAYVLGQQGADKASKSAQDDNGSSAPRSGAAPSGSADTGTKGKDPQAPKGAVYKNLRIPVGYAVMFADEPPQPEDVDVFYEGDFGYAADMINGDALATNQSRNSMALLGPGEPGSLAGCRANTRYTTSITKDVKGLPEPVRQCGPHGVAQRDRPLNRQSRPATVPVRPARARNHYPGPLLLGAQKGASGGDELVPPGAGGPFAVQPSWCRVPGEGREFGHEGEARVAELGAQGAHAVFEREICRRRE